MANKDDSENNAIDPRRIRRKTKNQRSFDQVKGFDDIEKVEFKKKGKGSYLVEKQEYQKKLDKRSKELEYAPFDHDRKSRAASSPIPVLKNKLVVDDLKAPEAQPTNIEKVTFAKFLRVKKPKRKTQGKTKEK